MQTYCEYNSTTQSAVCNLTLQIFDSRGYVSSDTEELLIAKKKDVEPELYVKKYVTPDVVQLGQPFELHIRIVGRGFVVERSDLSVVTVIDKSESMHAGNLEEAHTERTKFGEFSYPLNPSVLTANFSVGESHKMKCLRSSIHDRGNAILEPVCYGESAIRCYPKRSFYALC